MSSLQRVVMADWLDAIEAIIAVSPETCTWLVEFLYTDSQKNLKPCLLECASRDIRSNFSHLLEKSLNLVKHTGDSDTVLVNTVLSSLVDMMARDVPDHVKLCRQYFWTPKKS